MFPEEDEIRRGLSQRRFESVDCVWPEIRRGLEPRVELGRRRVAVAVTSVLAVLVVFSSALLFRNARVPQRRLRSIEFRVANVQSLGRPGEALVLQPDARTVLVVVR